MNIIYQAITNIISNKEAFDIHPTIALSMDDALGGGEAGRGPEVRGADKNRAYIELQLLRIDKRELIWKQERQDLKS